MKASAYRRYAVDHGMIPTAGMQKEIDYAKHKQMTIKYFDEDMKEEA